MSEDQKEIAVYFRTTDVQRTWKQYGWVPPSEQPETCQKWAFFRTLDTEHQERKQ